MIIFSKLSIGGGGKFRLPIELGGGKFKLPMELGGGRLRFPRELGGGTGGG